MSQCDACSRLRLFESIRIKIRINQHLLEANICHPYFLPFAGLLIHVIRCRRSTMRAVFEQYTQKAPRHKLHCTFASFEFPTAMSKTSMHMSR